MNHFFLVLLTIMGFNYNPGPVRLHKQLTLSEKIQAWYDLHFYELLLIILIMLMIIFILAIICTIPGTESGLYYNRLNGVI